MEIIKPMDDSSWDLKEVKYLRKAIDKEYQNGKHNREIKGNKR